jgi:aurora kinase, other
LKYIVNEFRETPKLSDFAIIRHLGEGRFGAVSMVVHKDSNFVFALKCVKKSVIKANKIEKQFIMELKIQMYLSHPNILKLYGVFDDA